MQDLPSTATAPADQRASDFRRERAETRLHAAADLQSRAAPLTALTDLAEAAREAAIAEAIAALDVAGLEQVESLESLESPIWDGRPTRGAAPAAYRVIGIGGATIASFEAVVSTSSDWRHDHAVEQLHRTLSEIATTLAAGVLGDDGLAGEEATRLAHATASAAAAGIIEAHRAAASVVPATVVETGARSYRPLSSITVITVASGTLPAALVRAHSEMEPASGGFPTRLSIALPGHERGHGFRGDPRFTNRWTPAALGVSGFEFADGSSMVVSDRFAAAVAARFHV